MPLKPAFKLLILAVIVLLAAAGCSKPAVKPSDEVAAADKALTAFEGMKKAYVSRDARGVTDPVSPDFKGGAAEFSGRIRKDMDAFDKVELDVAVERVEEAEDAVKVVFHWRGTWRDRTGLASFGRGNCVFVFKEAGAMQLYDIVGDSPFDVVR